MENVLKLFTDGSVKTNDGREFTRLLGGFGDGKPMFLFWQCADLLGLKPKAIGENFTNNESKFEKGIDYVDLKSDVDMVDSENIIDITGFLKEIGYSQNKLNATKKWLAFSLAGMMKLVKIATTKESWDIYNAFLEDYFMTKARVEVLEKSLEKELEELIKDRKFIAGELIYSESEEERFKLSIKKKNIDERIEELKVTIATRDKDKLIEEYKPKVESYNQFQDTENLLSWDTVAKNLKIGKNIMLQTLRDHKILQEDTYEYKGKRYTGESHNVPYQAYMKHFNVKYTTNGKRRFPKVLVTARGQEYLFKKLKEYGALAS